VAIAAGVVAIGVGVAWQVIAANHDDGPTVRNDPTSELTDVYAWMTSDRTKVNLIMNVYPNAPGSAKFSSDVLYVFHLNSSAGYGMTATETKIICGFDAAQTISCWVGNGDSVTGNAGVPAGLVSASGKTRVFAGLRDDPSFFNQTGFAAAASAIVGAMPLQADGAGCPTLAPAISTALLAQLTGNGSNGPASNNFAGQNVLGIVIQVDTTLVTPGGKILGVWASTHHRG
jgi:Domain of unknown function (DUF4331)